MTAHTILRWTTALLLWTFPQVATAQDALIQPDALRADLDLALHMVREQHPALGEVVDEEALDREVKRIVEELDRPVSQRQAWKMLTRLNPYFADGHLLIGMPDWRGEAARAIADGRGLFPFEIKLDDQGQPRIAAALGGAVQPLAGTPIRRINGRDAHDVAADMLRRAHGDTPRMRRALVSERWWFFYSMLFGSPDRFDLVLDGVRTFELHSSPAFMLPAAIAREESFEANFQCRIEPDGRAVMRLGTFGWPDKPRYLEFTRACFANMHGSGTGKLLIDVSTNGGGSDDLWFEGIMPYVTARPWRSGSTYLKRVVEDDPENGEIAGEIVAGENSLREARPVDDELFYRGDIEVRIGPMTYSSAVLFANVMRDFGFARICGSGGAVRTRQTGGVRTTMLPATGLFLSFPRFILAPPSGDMAPQKLEASGDCKFQS